MGDAEGRNKEASKVIQTTRQRNTAHPRQSLFQKKWAALDGIRTHLRQLSFDMYMHNVTVESKAKQCRQCLKNEYYIYMYM